MTRVILLAHERSVFGADRLLFWGKELTAGEVLVDWGQVEHEELSLPGLPGGNTVMEEKAHVLPGV